MNRYHKQPQEPKRHGTQSIREWRTLAWRLRGLLLVLSWAATLAGNTRGAEQQPDEGSEVNREYAIKAAYLYQFGRYVQWPTDSFADAQAPLVIGVLGPDPFGGILDEVARTKKVEGHSIVIRRMNSMAEYAPCHILFVVGSGNAEQKAQALETLRGTNVLLVGEEPNFTEHGGTINFFFDENRIRFEINAEAAKQDQLKISSKLLSLAKLVRRE